MQTRTDGTATGDKSRKYWAFISYGNRDARRWAVPLHRRLEAYRVPKSLVGRKIADEAIPARLRPVFRDRDELSAGPDLPQQIREALAASRYLIVVCSPHSKASEYVGKEILWFKQSGGSDRIIAYIVDGEPDECFRDELRHEFDDRGEPLPGLGREPLAADARPGRDGKDAMLKIVAGMLQVSFDELKRRELQRRQRLLLAVSGVTTAIVVLLAALAIWALAERDRANEQTTVARKNEQEAKTQRGLAETNAKLADDRRLRIRRNLYSAQMMRSSRDYDADFIARTKETLDAWLPDGSKDDDLRRFEWYYLRRLSHAERMILTGTGGPLSAAAWSPDGRLIAAACEQEVELPFAYIKYTSSSNPLHTGDRVRSGVVRVWNVEGGYERAVLTGHEGSVHAVAFSPNGRMLASAGDDSVIRLWDAETFKPRGTLAGHEGIVYGLAFRPDGRLASCGQDHSVRLWDVAGRSTSTILTGHDDAVFCVAFNREGLLASCGYDNTIRLWNVDGTPGQVLQVDDSIPTAVAFHPDGKQLASTGADRALRLWDVAAGKVLTSHGGMPNLGTGLSYSADGRFLAVGSWDQSVDVRHAKSGQFLWRYRGHTGFINAVAFAPQGTLLASAAADQTIRVWDASIAPEYVGIGVGGAVLSVAFSPDGRSVAAASDRNPRLEKTDDVRVFDASDGTERYRLVGHQGSIHGVTFHPDGRRLASCGYAEDRNSGEIKIWDGSTQKELFSLPAPRQVAAVAFSPDGRRLASACRDGNLYLHGADDGKLETTLTGHAGGVNSIAWSRDGKRLASGSFDKTIIVWDAGTGHAVHTLEGHEHLVRGAAFSPDGLSLASAGWDKTVRVWDLTVGKQKAVLHGHNGLLYGVLYSSDGDRLFSCAGDTLQQGEIKVWDAVTFEELLTLRGHRSFIYGIALDPKDERLASGGNEGTLVLWHAPRTTSP